MEFKKGSTYTRNEIHMLYFGKPVPKTGTGDWTTGYVRVKNELIILQNNKCRSLWNLKDETLRKLIVDQLFRKYVSDDEASFSRELYMSVDQIKCMSRNGMYIGSHGYNHYWLNALPAEKQEQEIDKSLQFLSSVDAPTDD